LPAADMEKYDVPLIEVGSKLNDPLRTELAMGV
jgi:hypothetical protein